MENGRETEADVQSFTEAADRMEMDMIQIVEFAKQMKIKQQRDALFEGMSSSARSAIENSRGPLDVNQLAKLLKDISEKPPSDVIKSLNRYNRNDIERIKNQLNDVENAIKENAKKQKEISDRLTKRIKKITEDVTKKRLDPTKRQHTLDQYRASTSGQQAERESTSREEDSEEFELHGTMKRTKVNRTLMS